MHFPINALSIWTNVSNVSESQNVSVSSRLGNHDVSSRSRLGQNSQCLGLVSVSDTWVSCLVSVSALKVSWTSLHCRSNNATTNELRHQIRRGNRYSGGGEAEGTARSFYRHHKNHFCRNNLKTGNMVCAMPGWMRQQRIHALQGAPAFAQLQWRNFRLRPPPRKAYIGLLVC